VVREGHRVRQGILKVLEGGRTDGFYTSQRRHEPLQTVAEGLIEGQIQYLIHRTLLSRCGWWRCALTFFDF
jgi:hypothetical protein